MQIFENVRLALSGLKSNKMRALLTMLGIIIGIGSVIAIVTVGNSLTNSITSEMASIGVTNIQVMLAEKETDFSDPRAAMMGGTVRVTESDRITEDMIEGYRASYSSDFKAIGASKSIGGGKATDGRKYANVDIYAATPDQKIIDNLEIVKGRYLNDADVSAKRFVAVVSDKFINNMFRKNEDPLGRQINVSVNDTIQEYTIVGVYKYVESAFNFSTASEKDISTSMFIPLSIWKTAAVNQMEGFGSFVVMAKGDRDLDAVTDNIERFFNRFYESNEKFKVSTIKMETMISGVSNMLGTLSIAISVIAGISLLVGGIGVMNIMLVSVTERTREIGTRKALGARNSDIMAQFITEAIIICVIGGIIGIILGLLLGDFGANLLGYPAAPSMETIIIAVAFSMLIGTFFGFYPARKAAKLDPIDALRYE